MPCILHIETSTKVCSLALSLDEKLIFNRIEAKDASHASLLGIYVSEAMEYLRSNNLKLDAVAVSSGPGSYTGLRIGVSLAKGVCYAWDIPLIALPSLKILTSQLFYLELFRKWEKNTLFIPMIDARRMEVYSAIYDKNMNEIRSVQPDIVDESIYKEYLKDNCVVFFGDGSSKCKELVQSQNALFIDDVYPTASSMIPLSEKVYSDKNFVDVAYFEPFYLKEFQATIAKNKVIPQLKASQNAKE